MVWMMLVKLILVLGLLAIFFTCLLLALNSHPPRHSVENPPSRYGLNFSEVSFPSRDGVKLNGWFLTGTSGQKGEALQRPAVVICHGLGASKSDFTVLASNLVQAGFHVLLFDFRAHGESEGFRTSFGYLEQRDLEGAIRFLKQHPAVYPERVGAYGFSMGAAVVILTAARNKDIKAVVSDSAFSSLEDQIVRIVTSFYHLPSIPFYSLAHGIYDLYFWTCLKAVSPIDAVSKLSPRPILLIAGQSDDRMTATDAHRLYEAAVQPKELWVVHRAGHGETLAAAGETYPERVADFFKRAL